MGRIHGRSHRDWAVNSFVENTYSFALMTVPGPVRYQLDMTVTEEEGRRLMELITDPGTSGPYRGALTWSGFGGGVLHIRGIEITEQEVFRITRDREDPYDVIAPAFPECGYRLFAVPDPLVLGR